uniref:Uncharacterized protein n=1 Tax=Plectus sambesii TaxID=2011161 RepID=A0A914XQB0_9BILA
MRNKRTVQRKTKKSNSARPSKAYKHQQRRHDPTLSAVAGQESPPLETAGVVGAATVASILGDQPIRQRVGRRLHEGRAGRNGAQHNTRPSATELAMKRAGMRRQHAARKVGGARVTSCPPDFGAERHRRRRHRPEVSPQPATALLRPPEEQSRRSDNKTTTAEKYTIRERLLVTTTVNRTKQRHRCNQPTKQREKA